MLVFVLCLLLFAFIVADVICYAIACDRIGSQTDIYGRWITIIPGSGFFCLIRSRKHP